MVLVSVVPSPEPVKVTDAVSSGVELLEAVVAVVLGHELRPEGFGRLRRARTGGGTSSCGEERVGEQLLGRRAPARGE